MYYTRPYRQEDREYLLGDEFVITEIEEREAWASSGEHPKDVLARSIDITDDLFVICRDERIVAVYGISYAGTLKDESVIGVPWMIRQDDLVETYEERDKFFKGCHDFIRMMSGKYDFLANIVGEENEVSITWLKKIGFRFDPLPVYFKDPTFPFLRFYMWTNE